jgi:hypothetical protein
MIQDGDWNTATDLLTSVIQGLSWEAGDTLDKVKHQGELKHQHTETLAPGRRLHATIYLKNVWPVGSHPMAIKDSLLELPLHPLLPFTVTMSNSGGNDYGAWQLEASWLPWQLPLAGNGSWPILQIHITLSPSPPNLNLSQHPIIP